MLSEYFSLEAIPLLKGSNSKQNKALNLRLVLSEIVTQGPISRIEISRLTHLTKQTITNMVEELLETGLVLETGVKKEGSVGKPSKMLNLNQNEAYSFAIRLTTNHMECGLFSLKGEKIAVASCALKEGQLIDQAKQQLSLILSQAELNKSAILGVGVTLADNPSQDTSARQQQEQLQRDLCTALELPVAMETTASACAAYHMLYGEAKQLHSFVYVHIGDVVECAVVYDRKIFLGQNGLTGALGELFVTPETNKATGELGRLNDFASLSSLKQLLGKSLSNEELISYCEQNPNKIAPWFDRAAEPMRIAVHSLESLLNCQSIIIGGDLSPWFLDKFITQLRPLIPSISQFGERDVLRVIKTPNVEVISLKGVATLPLHAALSIENMQTLVIPQSASLTPIQSLIYT